tara:strand:- start:112 stop:462 length:351 start_codon:yes stop_codon:yes gene_type:complete
MNTAIRLDRKEFEDKLNKIFDTHHEIKTLVRGEDEKVRSINLVNEFKRLMEVYDFQRRKLAWTIRDYNAKHGVDESSMFMMNFCKEADEHLKDWLNRHSEKLNNESIKYPLTDIDY